MATQGRRSSPRLREMAQKEAEDEENERLAKEDDLKAQGLPTDGSLEFRFINKMSASGAFQIRYKDLYLTEEDKKSCSWAIEAYWNVANFYPGQFLKFTHAFPQCDPEAKYNLGYGTYAGTTAGPVGVKYRFAVVLWTTTVNLFVLPLYTLNQGTTLDNMPEERVKDFVTLTRETVKDPLKTTWAGHSIIMNYNPEISGLADICYADLSMARTIGRKEWLEEHIGCIDGDEYFRLLSLYKIRSNEWLKQAFDKFECGTEYDDKMIVQPGSVLDKRKEYDHYENWQKLMADKKFDKSFLSLKARQRYIQTKKKKKKPASGSGVGGGGPGSGPGPGPSKGPGGAITKSGTPKKLKKPALGK